MTNDDMRLVWEYAVHQSEQAFEALVLRQNDAQGTARPTFRVVLG